MHVGWIEIKNMQHRFRKPFIYCILPLSSLDNAFFTKRLGVVITPKFTAKRCNVGDKPNKLVAIPPGQHTIIFTPRGRISKANARVNTRI